MVNYIPEYYPFYPTDHCGVIRLKSNIIHPKYLAWVLNKEGINQGFSRSYRASSERVKGLIIKTPSIEIQQTIVTQIEALEAKITQAQTVIDGSKARKEAVLKSYLT